MEATMSVCFGGAMDGKPFRGTRAPKGYKALEIRYKGENRTVFVPNGMKTDRMSLNMQVVRNALMAVDRADAEECDDE